MEFLTHVTITVPADVSPEELVRLKSAETEQALELERAGNLIRLWRPVTTGWENIGLWRALDEEDLMRLIKSLPLFPFMEVTVTELRDHPSDPGLR